MLGPSPMFTISEKIIAFLSPDTIEPQALQQLVNTSESPVLAHHLAVMPDCHYGKGSTVGSVIPTSGGIIPAAVGVDIGCGMIAVQTTFRLCQLEVQLDSIQTDIERHIPSATGAKNTQITSSSQKRIEMLPRRAAGLQFRTFA